MPKKPSSFPTFFPNFRALLLPDIPCRSTNGKEKPDSSRLKEDVEMLSSGNILN